MIDGKDASFTKRGYIVDPHARARGRRLPPERPTRSRPSASARCAARTRTRSTATPATSASSAWPSSTSAARTRSPWPATRSQREQRQPLPRPFATRLRERPLKRRSRAARATRVALASFVCFFVAEAIASSLRKLAAALRDDRAWLELNPSQRAAVEHESGRCSSSPAPARARRASSPSASRASSSAASPRESILAMTFTNKAAAEMRERVVAPRRQRKVAQGPRTVSTFHSLRPRRARRRDARARPPRHGVHDLRSGRQRRRRARDPPRRRRRQELRHRARSSRASPTPRTRSSTPTICANASATQGRSTSTTRSPTLVYPRYQAALRIVPRVRLRRSRLRGRSASGSARADVRERWQQRVPLRHRRRVPGHQPRAARAAAPPRRRAPQRLRRRRRRPVHLRLARRRRAQHPRLRAALPAARKVVKLEQNYRSSRPILDVANAVIAKRRRAAAQEELVADARRRRAAVQRRRRRRPRGRGELRRRARSSGSSREGAAPAGHRGPLPLERPVAAARGGAARSGRSRIRMIGGQQFFERKEVKDLIAYLSSPSTPPTRFAPPHHQLSGARHRRRRASTKLGAHATAHDSSLWQAVERAARASTSSRPRRTRAAAQLERIVEATRARLDAGVAPPSVGARARSRDDRPQGGHPGRLDATPGGRAPLGQRRGHPRTSSRAATSRAKATARVRRVPRGSSRCAEDETKRRTPPTASP